MNPAIVQALLAAIAANNAVMTLLLGGASIEVAKTAKTAKTTTPSADDLLGGGEPAAPDANALLGEAAAAPVVAAPVAAPTAPAKRIPNLDALAKARAAAKAKRDAAAAGAPAVAAAAPTVVVAVAPTTAVVDFNAIKTLGVSWLKKDAKNGNALQALLKAHGAANLTALTPDKYVAFHAALVKAIG